MNKPLIPSITIYIQQIGSLIYAYARDETSQYRGDCVSGSQSDIDQWVSEWEDKTLQLNIVNETSPAVTGEAGYQPLNDK